MAFVRNPVVYVPDLTNGRPIVDGKVYLLTAGTVPPTQDSAINPATLLTVTYVNEAGNTVTQPQPLYTSKGGCLYGSFPEEARQYMIAPQEYVFAAYDKIGRLQYSAETTASDYVEVDELAAADSTVLVGGVEAGDISKRIAGERSILEFGVIGNGIADDTAALNAAFAFGYTNDVKIIGPQNLTCLVSDTVVMNCNADLSGVTFTTAVGFAKPVIRTSAELAGVNLLRDMEIKYPQVISKRVFPSSPVVGSAGIRFDGCRNNVFYINYIYGYDDGVLYYSNNSNSFFAYNTIHYTNLIFGSRRNIHFLTELTGWVNECTHIGGQFAQVSSDASQYNACNIKFTKVGTTGNNPPNGHTFIGSSMEGNFADGTIWQDYTGSTSFSSSNVFIGCRFEAAVRFRLAAIALGDTFIGCWGMTFATFDNNVKPIMNGVFAFNYENQNAPSPGAATVRRNNFIPQFNANNTGSAIAIGAGTSGRLNGAISGSGFHESYHPTDEAQLWPMLRAGVIGGLPSLYFGDGTADLTEYLRRWAGGQWRHNFNLVPADNNTRTLGASGNVYANIFSTNFRPGAGTVTWTSGAGSPEGVVTLPVGSMYTRTDGGAGTTLYVKESGTGATGWIAK